MISPGDERLKCRALAAGRRAFRLAARHRLLIVGVVFALAVAACGASTVSEKNIQRTVDAKVTTAVAGIPTATPLVLAPTPGATQLNARGVPHPCGARVGHPRFLTTSCSGRVGGVAQG